LNKKKEAEMWKEYFDKLLNTEEPRELIKKKKEIKKLEKLNLEQNNSI